MMWTLIGVSLLLWLGWDLYSGEVWLHRAFLREQEPLGYWLGMALWLGVALSCLLSDWR
ncbi:hypothetical protein [Balneatrix alpica]|uniref:Uncharacterized protein n=1 Tax=Balneatrix alpica TaxID=75684 RepID=A0ABV5ZGQ3_9GAMM|nr:hypothetical protein [Balneatrix alpica]